VTIPLVNPSGELTNILADERAKKSGYSPEFNSTLSKWKRPLFRAKLLISQLGFFITARPLAASSPPAEETAVLPSHEPIPVKFAHELHVETQPVDDSGHWSIVASEVGLSIVLACVCWFA
jgi:hypothetical protein